MSQHNTNQQVSPFDRYINPQKDIEKGDPNSRDYALSDDGLARLRELYFKKKNKTITEDEQKEVVALAATLKSFKEEHRADAREDTYFDDLMDGFAKNAYYGLRQTAASLSEGIPILEELFGGEDSAQRIKNELRLRPDLKIEHPSAEFIGGSVGSVVKFVPAMLATGGAAAILGAGSLLLTGIEAAGGARQTYRDIKRENNEDINPIEEIIYTVGGATLEIGATYFGLKGVAAASERAIMKIGMAQITRAAAGNKKIYKELAKAMAGGALSEAQEEGITQVGNDVMESLYNSKQGVYDEGIAEYISRVAPEVGLAMAGGAIGGSALAPFSAIGARRRINKRVNDLTVKSGDVANSTLGKGLEKDAVDIESTRQQIINKRLDKELKGLKDSELVVATQNPEQFIEDKLSKAENIAEKTYYNKLLTDVKQLRSATDGELAEMETLSPIDKEAILNGAENGSAVEFGYADFPDNPSSFVQKGVKHFLNRNGYHVGEFELISDEGGNPVGYRAKVNSQERIVEAALGAAKIDATQGEEGDTSPYRGATLTPAEFDEKISTTEGKIKLIEQKISQAINQGAFHDSENVSLYEFALSSLKGELGETVRQDKKVSQKKRAELIAEKENIPEEFIEKKFHDVEFDLDIHGDVSVMEATKEAFRKVGSVLTGNTVVKKRVPLKVKRRFRVGDKVKVNLFGRLETNKYGKIVDEDHNPEATIKRIGVDKNGRAFAELEGNPIPTGRLETFFGKKESGDVSRIYFNNKNDWHLIKQQDAAVALGTTAKSDEEIAIEKIDKVIDLVEGIDLPDNVGNLIKFKKDKSDEGWRLGYVLTDNDGNPIINGSGANSSVQVYEVDGKNKTLSSSVVPVPTVLISPDTAKRAVTKVAKEKRNDSLHEERARANEQRQQKINEISGNTATAAALDIVDSYGDFHEGLAFNSEQIDPIQFSDNPEVESLQTEIKEKYGGVVSDSQARTIAIHIASLYGLEGLPETNFNLDASGTGVGKSTMELITAFEIWDRAGRKSPIAIFTATKEAKGHLLNEVNKIIERAENSPDNTNQHFIDALKVKLFFRIGTYNDLVHSAKRSLIYDGYIDFLQVLSRVGTTAQVPDNKTWGQYKQIEGMKEVPNPNDIEKIGDPKSIKNAKELRVKIAGHKAVVDFLETINADSQLSDARGKAVTFATVINSMTAKVKDPLMLADRDAYVYSDTSFENDRLPNIDENQAGAIFDEAHDIETFGGIGEAGENRENSGKAKIANTFLDDLLGNNGKVIYYSATPFESNLGAINTLARLNGINQQEAVERLGLPTNALFKKNTRSQERTRENVRNEMNEAAQRGQFVSQAIPFWGDSITFDMDLTDAQKIELKSIEEYHLQKSNKSIVEDLTESQFRQYLNDLKTWTESIKVDAIFDQIVNDILDGRQSVVFTTRNSVPSMGEGFSFKGDPNGIQSFASKLVAKLEQAGIPFSDLGTSKDTASSIAQFQSGATKVIIGSYQKMSTGIDLDDQTGDVPRSVYLTSLPDRAISFMQSIGRVSRFSTKSPSILKIFIVNDSNSDKILRSIVERKIRILGEATASKVRADEFISKLNQIDDVVARADAIVQFISDEVLAGLITTFDRKGLNILDADLDSIKVLARLAIIAKDPEANMDIVDQMADNIAKALLHAKMDIQKDQSVRASLHGKTKLVINPDDGKFVELSIDEDGNTSLTESTLGIIVHHGSPVRVPFTKFDIAFVGTGEGTTFEGHGLYFSDAVSVAEWYVDALTRVRYDQSALSGIVGNNGLTRTITINGYELQLKFKVPSGFNQSDLSLVAEVVIHDPNTRQDFKTSDIIDDGNDSLRLKYKDRIDNLNQLINAIEDPDPTQFITAKERYSDKLDSYKINLKEITEKLEALPEAPRKINDLDIFMADVFKKNVFDHSKPEGFSNNLTDKQAFSAVLLDRKARVSNVLDKIKTHKKDIHSARTSKKIIEKVNNDVGKPIGDAEVIYSQADHIDALRDATSLIRYAIDHIYYENIDEPIPLTPNAIHSFLDSIVDDIENNVKINEKEESDTYVVSLNGIRDLRNNKNWELIQHTYFKIYEEVKNDSDTYIIPQILTDINQALRNSVVLKLGEGQVGYGAALYSSDMSLDLTITSINNTIEKRISKYNKDDVTLNEHIFSLGLSSGIFRMNTKTIKAASIRYELAQKTRDRWSDEFDTANEDDTVDPKYVAMLSKSLEEAWEEVNQSEVDLSLMLGGTIRGGTDYDQAKVLENTEGGASQYIVLNEKAFDEEGNFIGVGSTSSFKGDPIKKGNPVPKGFVFEAILHEGKHPDEYYYAQWKQPLKGRDIKKILKSYGISEEQVESLFEENSEHIRKYNLQPITIDQIDQLIISGYSIGENEIRKINDLMIFAVHNYNANNEFDELSSPSIGSRLLGESRSRDQYFRKLTTREIIQSIYELSRNDIKGINKLQDDKKLTDNDIKVLGLMANAVVDGIGNKIFSWHKLQDNILKPLAEELSSDLESLLDSVSPNELKGHTTIDKDGNVNEIPESIPLEDIQKGSTASSIIRDFYAITSRRLFEYTFDADEADSLKRSTNFNNKFKQGWLDSLNGDMGALSIKDMMMYVLDNDEDINVGSTYYAILKEFSDKVSSYNLELFDSDLGDIVQRLQDFNQLSIIGQHIDNRKLVYSKNNENEGFILPNERREDGLTTYGSFYKKINQSAFGNNERNVSLRMLKAGIDGSIYPSDSGRREDQRNRVVYDDAEIKIRSVQARFKLRSDESRGKVIGIPFEKAKEGFYHVTENMRQDVKDSIVFLETLDDLKEENPQLHKWYMDKVVNGNQGANAIYDIGLDKVYVIASQIEKGTTIEQVIAHEVLGHLGLRRALGKEFDSVMEDVYEEFKDDPNFKKIADKYAKSFERARLSEKDSRIAAAEEYLSAIAEYGVGKDGDITIKNFLQRIGKLIEKLFGIKTNESTVQKLLSMSASHVFETQTGEGIKVPLRSLTTQHKIIAKESKITHTGESAEVSQTVFTLDTGHKAIVEVVFDKDQKLATVSWMGVIPQIFNNTPINELPSTDPSDFTVDYYASIGKIGFGNIKQILRELVLDNPEISSISFERVSGKMSGSIINIKPDYLFKGDRTAFDIDESRVIKTQLPTFISTKNLNDGNVPLSETERGRSLINRVGELIISNVIIKSLGDPSIINEFVHNKTITADDAKFIQEIRSGYLLESFLKASSKDKAGKSPDVSDLKIIDSKKFNVKDYLIQKVGTIEEFSEAFENIFGFQSGLIDRTLDTNDADFFAADEKGEIEALYDLNLVLNSLQNYLKKNKNEEYSKILDFFINNRDKFGDITVFVNGAKSRGLLGKAGLNGFGEDGLIYIYRDGITRTAYTKNWYFGKSKSVESVLMNTLVHEITHIYTSTILTRPNELLSSKELELKTFIETSFKKLNDLRETFNLDKNLIALSGLNGFTSIEEFVSELFGNPDFRKLIDSISSDSTPEVSIFGKFIRLLQNIFGTSKENVEMLKQHFKDHDVFSKILEDLNSIESNIGRFTNGTDSFNNLSNNPDVSDLIFSMLVRGVTPEEGEVRRLRDLAKLTDDEVDIFRFFDPLPINSNALKIDSLEAFEDKEIALTASEMTTVAYEALRTIEQSTLPDSIKLEVKHKIQKEFGERFRKQSMELQNSATEMFHTTEDPSDAAFVFPNGVMLAFANPISRINRELNVGLDNSKTKKHFLNAHVDILAVLKRVYGEETPIEQSSNAISEFVSKTGSMRITHSPQGSFEIEVSNRITSAQRKIIIKSIKEIQNYSTVTINETTGISFDPDQSSRFIQGSKVSDIIKAMEKSDARFEDPLADLKLNESSRMKDDIDDYGDGVRFMLHDEGRDVDFDDLSENPLDLEGYVEGSTIARETERRRNKLLDWVTNKFFGRGGGLNQLRRMLMSNPTRRMISLAWDTKSKTVIDIVENMASLLWLDPVMRRHVGGKSARLSMQNRMQVERNKRAHELNVLFKEIRKTLDELGFSRGTGPIKVVTAEGYRLLNNLIREDKWKKTETLTDNELSLAPLAEKIRKYLNSMLEYQTDAGVLTDEQGLEGYLTRKYDKKAMLGKKNEFVELVKVNLIRISSGKVDEATAQEYAERIYNKIVGDEYAFRDVHVQHLKNRKGKNTIKIDLIPDPYGLDEITGRIEKILRGTKVAIPGSMKHRALWFIKDSELDGLGVLRNDLSGILNEYTNLTIRRVEFERNLGKNYEILQQAVNAIMSSDLTLPQKKAIAENMIQTVRAFVGTLDTDSASNRMGDKIAETFTHKDEKGWTRRATRMLTAITSWMVLGASAVASVSEFATPFSMLGIRSLPGQFRGVKTALTLPFPKLGDTDLKRIVSGLGLAAEMGSLRGELMMGTRVEKSQSFINSGNNFYHMYVSMLTPLTILQRYMMTGALDGELVRLLSMDFSQLSEKDKRIMGRLAFGETKENFEYIKQAHGKFKRDENLTKAEFLAISSIYQYGATDGIVEAHSGNRPLWMSSQNPLQILIGQISSFQEAFRNGPLAWAEDEFRGGDIPDRILQMLRLLPFLFLAYISRSYLNDLRQESATPQERRKMKKRDRNRSGLEKAAEIASYSGLTGSADRFFRAGESIVKYDEDLLGAFMGPGFNIASDFTIGTLKMGIPGKFDEGKNQVIRQLEKAVSPIPGANTLLFNKPHKESFPIMQGKKFVKTILDK